MKVVGPALVAFIIVFVGSVNASSSTSFDYNNQDLWKSIEFEAPVVNECGEDANSPINVPADMAASCTINAEGIQLNVSRL